MFFRLLKIHLKNLYAPSVFFEGFKKGIKSVIKNIVLLILILYGIGMFFAAMFLMARGVYAALEFSGSLKFMPAVSLCVCALSVLFLGITSVASTYYSGGGDDQFLAMPLSATDIFRAKFAVSFITDGVFAIILFAMFAAVYGAGTGMLKNPIFYLGFLAATLSLTLVIITLIYALLILILMIFPALRKKSFLTMAATVIFVAFVIAYSLFSGFSAQSVATADFSSDGGNFFPLALRLSSLAGRFPALFFLSTALDGKILPIIAHLIICALVIFLLIPLLAGFYARTLAGFSDVKARKIAPQKLLKEENVREKSAFGALLIRDVRTVLREPAFFANGPLLVFLLPLIVIFSLYISVSVASGTPISEILLALKTFFARLMADPDRFQKISYYISLAAAAFVFFGGCSSNIASTSFSREGKGLAGLKAMPVSFETILKVKVFHSLIYVLAELAIFLIFAVAVNCAAGIFLPWTIFLRISGAAIVLASCASIPMTFSAMLLDAANPKLNWEIPAAAFKQNINAVISMLFSFIILGIFAGLGVLLPARQSSVIIIAFVMIVIGAPLGSFYFGYGARKLGEVC